MTPDIGLEVWLEHQAQAKLVYLIPQLRSAVDLALTYAITLEQHSASGNARMLQQGRVETRAKEVVALSRLALSPRGDGRCEMEVVLRRDGNEVGVFRFDCKQPN